MILELSALDRLERDTSSAAAATAEARLGRGVVVRVPACVRHVHVWPGTPRPAGKHFEFWRLSLSRLPGEEARRSRPAGGTWAHRVPGPMCGGGAEGGGRDLPRGVGGLVLHLSDLLGGPLAELLGLGALGAPTLRQEVVDGLHVDHAQHVRAEGGQQVPAGKEERMKHPPITPIKWEGANKKRVERILSSKPN